MKRRILCFVLTMAMVLSMLVVIPATVVSADAWSTSGTTHHIATANDLMSFASAVTSSEHFSGHKVVLDNDINMSGKEWKGVGWDAGSNNGYFSGTFDGQGYTITNLNSPTGQRSVDDQGALFCKLADGAVVKNVKLYGTITIKHPYSTYNADYFGTVTGRVGSGRVTIKNVYSAMNIDASHFDDSNPTNHGLRNVGGLVGVVANGNATDLLTIESCVYAGSMTCSSKASGGNRPYNWGGLVGAFRSSGSSTCRMYLSNCVYSGSFSGYSMNHFGAFVGAVYNGSGNSGSLYIWADNCIAAGTASLQPNGSGKANYNGYLFGSYSGFINNSSPASTSLSSSSGDKIRIYAQNCYYVSANYSKNSNATNTFTSISPTQALTNRTDRASAASISPSKTADGNTGNSSEYRVVDITLADLKSMTASNTNFSDTLKWDFGTANDIPLPSGYEEVSCFDDLTESEFVITRDDEMDEFASLVSSGTTFAGKTIKLGADVALSKKVGYTGSSGNRKWFSGNFDGQGHTVILAQTISNPDGDGGLFSMLRVPENSTITIQNVHLTGTISLSNNTTGMGYTGGLISAVDAGLSGNGGTINITNVWNTVRINGGNANAWNSLGGMIGFVRHESGVKPLTINFESCVWDGVINSGPALYMCGGFIGYTGNNNAGRTLEINISNSVATGTFQCNIDYNHDFGMLLGYIKGASSADATAKPTVNITNVVSMGKATYSKAISGSSIGVVDKIDGTTELNMTNLYYTEFNRSNLAGDFPVIATGTATSGSATLKDKVGMFNLAATAFSDSSKWNVSAGYPCPAGIVSTFGAVPSSLAVTAYDVYDSFEIGTPAALKAVADEVNAGTHTYAGKTILLTADLDMTDTGFAGIGVTSSYPFSGNFNGQGHTVTISQTLSNPDGNGGLFSFVRVPADSTLTIQNVHLAGTITLTNSDTGKGYVGALISCVDAGTSGSGGTLNVTNVWSTTRINAGNSNTWYAISSYIGFVRHNSGLKPITINIDSCLWDGVINAGPALEYSGAFVGYTGNQSGANRPLTLNITNSVAAGQIMLNTAYTDDTGLLVGYLKGNGTNSSTSVVTANFHDLVITGKFTSSVNVTKWCSLFQHSGTTTVDLNNFYYVSFNVPGKGEIPVHEGTGTVTGTPVVKTTVEMANLTGSAFSNASKWDLTHSGYPCPAGIVSTFGYPASLEIDPYDLSDVFTISTEAQLRALAADVNNNPAHTYAGKTVRLTADIELTSDWDPIGVRTGDSGNRMFRGTFDGQGHTVSNVTTRPSQNNRGAFFGYLGNGAVIENLYLDGRITTTAAETIYYIATVTNCTKDTVVIRNVHSGIDIYQNANGVGLYYTAGLVGFTEHNNSSTLTIEDCEYSGTINTGGYTRYVAGILGYNGNMQSTGYTKNITITGTVFSGQINLNAEGYYYANGGLIGGLQKNSGELSVTITDCSVQGKISFNPTRGWAKDGTTSGSSGQIIGHVTSGVTLNVTGVTYYEASHVTVANDSSTKVVIAEIGHYGDTFGHDLPGATPLPMNTVAAEKRNTSDSYKGVRFVATFYNTAQCLGGGTASANYGMYILPYDVYEGLGGATVTAAKLDAAGKDMGVLKVSATKYKDLSTTYTVSAVVYNLNTTARQEAALVAIPYVGTTLGDMGIATYNIVFN